MAAPASQGNHKLKSSPEAREGISAAAVGDIILIEPTLQGLRFLDATRRLLGTLTVRNDVAKRIAAGDTLQHCSVAWTYPASDRHPYGLASAFIVFGDADDPYLQWCAREVWGKPRVPRPARAYAINVVGWAYYQNGIGKCRAGDRLELFRELGNPYDSRATVVKTVGGETIGYVPRSSWLQRVIHDDGCGATVLFKGLETGTPVIEVMVSSEPLGEVAWHPPD